MAAPRLGPYKLHFFTEGCEEYWTPPLASHDPPLLYHMLRDPSEAYPLNASAPLYRGVCARSAARRGDSVLGRVRIAMGVCMAEVPAARIAVAAR